MTRAHAGSLAVLLLVAALALLLAGCGSDGDDRRDASGSGAKTETSTTGDDAPADEGEDDDAPATTVPEPVPAGEQPPIVVTSPAPLAYVNGTFVLRGSAEVYEGELRWAILDARLKPMAQGAFAASCGAPCRGTFSKRIPLRGVAIGSWELHVWAPPVDAGDPARMHDTMVPITVTDQPVDAPAPDAIPPGGAPAGA